MVNQMTESLKHDYSMSTPNINVNMSLIFTVCVCNAVGDNVIDSGDTSLECGESSDPVIQT